MSKKCETCGEELGPFERDVCGPCRIKDPKFKEELDEWPLLSFCNKCGHNIKEYDLRILLIN